MPLFHRFALALLLLFAVPGVARQEEMNAPDDVPGLVKALKEQRDAADVDLVKRLANKKTRESMEGLIEVYDELESVYMRRAVCQGLALYDDVPGAEQPALELLMNVATKAPQRTLREAAIELLGGCDNYGRSFLRQIVESPADDEVRARAMQHHVAHATAEDAGWYRSLFELPSEKARKEPRKPDAEAAKVPHPLAAVRLLAFEGLKAGMTSEDMIKATHDPQEKVRVSALMELDARGDKEVVGAAQSLYSKAGESNFTRLIAAQILLQHLGPKIADDFIKDATKSSTPRAFSFGLADLLVKLDDPDVNQRLLKQAGKGEGTELLFYLRATAHLEDPKLSKSLAKLLKDKDPEIQCAAADTLGERKAREELPELEKVVEKSENPLVVTAALDAITRIRTNDAQWEEALKAYAADPKMEIRNAAVEALGRTHNPDYLPVLLKALEHDDWSTRLAAAHALEALRVPEGVGALCQRMSSEEGRMAVEMSEILFRLTGKLYGVNARQWAEWWKNEGASFQPIAESKLHQLEQEEEAHRLKETTSSEFFGITIESHRVLFILDVSGSMNEPTRGQYVGEQGEPRFTLAKRELLKALDGLDQNSFFNIVTFSSGVSSWKDRILQKSETTLAEAKEFVGRLAADGGTNLYSSLETAFEDPDVDTIYLLSDGEPSVGPVIDPQGIRDRVAAWNRHRGVVINCIAVGGSFQVLEWLAQDTGGTHVRFP
jgi:HEAT repeat protein